MNCIFVTYFDADRFNSIFIRIKQKYQLIYGLNGCINQMLCIAFTGTN